MVMNLYGGLHFKRLIFVIEPNIFHQKSKQKKNQGQCHMTFPGMRTPNRDIILPRWSQVRLLNRGSGLYTYIPSILELKFTEVVKGDSRDLAHHSKGIENLALNTLVRQGQVRFGLVNFI